MTVDVIHSFYNLFSLLSTTKLFLRANVVGTFFYF